MLKNSKNIYIIILYCILIERISGKLIIKVVLNMEEKEKKIILKRNPVGIAGGAILIISAFLAWIEIPILGGGNLMDITRLITGLSEFGGAEGTLYSLVFIAILVLVLGGGIVALFKHEAGGGMAILGLIIFTIIALLLQSELNKSLGYLFSVNIFSLIGIGYYIAWVGAIVSIFSKMIEKKLIG